MASTNQPKNKDRHSSSKKEDSSDYDSEEAEEYDSEEADEEGLDSQLQAKIDRIKQNLKNPS